MTGRVTTEVVDAVSYFINTVGFREPKSQGTKLGTNLSDGSSVAPSSPSKPSQSSRNRHSMVLDNQPPLSRSSSVKRRSWSIEDPSFTTLVLTFFAGLRENSTVKLSRDLFGRCSILGGVIKLVDQAFEAKKYQKISSFASWMLWLSPFFLEIAKNMDLQDPLTKKTVALIDKHLVGITDVISIASLTVLFVAGKHRAFAGVSLSLFAIRELHHYRMLPKEISKFVTGYLNSGLVLFALALGNSSQRLSTLVYNGNRLYSIMTKT